MESLDLSFFNIIDFLDRKSKIMLRSTNKTMKFSLLKYEVYKKYGQLFLNFKPDQMTLEYWITNINSHSYLTNFAINEGLLEFLIYLNKNNHYISPLISEKALNHDHILSWLKTKNIFPDIDKAIKYKDLDYLIFLKSNGKSLTKEGVNLALKLNKKDIVDWFISFNIYPDDFVIIKTKKFNLLKDLKITLSQQGVNKAASKGLLDILEFYADQNLLPNNFPEIISHGHLNIIKWLKKKNIYPDDNSLKFIFKSKNSKEMVIYFLKEKRNIDQSVIDNLAISNNLDMVKFIYSQNLKITEDFGFSLAVANGAFEVWHWLEETKNMKITQKAADFALDEGRLDVLEILEKRNILPSCWGWFPFYCQSKNNKTELIDWIIYKKIKPNDEDLKNIFRWFNLSDLIILAKANLLKCSPKYTHFVQLNLDYEVLNWFKSNLDGDYLEE